VEADMQALERRVAQRSGTRWLPGTSSSSRRCCSSASWSAGSSARAPRETRTRRNSGAAKNARRPRRVGRV